MNTDAKLIKAKIGDLFDLCDKHCEAKFSSFLDGGYGKGASERSRWGYDGAF